MSVLERKQTVLKLLEQLRGALCPERIVLDRAELRARKQATQMRGGWFSYEAHFIRHFPLRILNLLNTAERA